MFPKKANKVQLIIPRHNYGILTDGALSAPQIGPLLLAAYLKKHEPDLEIEVFDENKTTNDSLIHQLDAEVIGISTWFSNYNSAVRIANQIKEQNKNSKIIFGGPNVNGIESRILKNQPNVDLVVTADGEEALRLIVAGEDYERISGLSYREDQIVKKNPLSFLELSKIPKFDLSMLKTEFRWNPHEDRLMSAFPLSGLRGCFRTERCAWCSIPLQGVRTVTGKIFWEQVKLLREKYGINLFYESGDTLLPDYVKEVAETKPTDIPQDVRLRGYSHIGLVNENYVQNLKKAGFFHLFFGIESVLVQDRKYSLSKMKEEFIRLREEGIQIMPGIILGLPGETNKTLEANVELISDLLSDKTFVSSCNLNTPYPLPGSKYFKMCVSNEEIISQYKDRTDQDLRETDRLDIPLLSELMMDAYTLVGSARVRERIHELGNNFSDRIAYWAAKI